MMEFVVILQNGSEMKFEKLKEAKLYAKENKSNLIIQRFIGKNWQWVRKLILSNGVVISRIKL